jgi:hypothetical protein
VLLVCFLNGPQEKARAPRTQGPIKPLVFLVSTKRAFYLIGVPVGSGEGCEEGTADGAAEGRGEGSSEGGKVGTGEETGMALVACAGRLT